MVKKRLNKNLAYPSVPVPVVKIRTRSVPLPTSAGIPAGTGIFAGTDIPTGP